MILALASRARPRRFFGIALLLTLVGGSSARVAAAQGTPDPVALRVLAVKSVHPAASPVHLLVVQDSLSTPAQAQAVARALGSRARYVRSADSLGVQDLAVRAAVKKANPTDAEVTVTIWGQVAAAGNHPAHTFFSIYLVTLRKNGGTWVVAKREQIWAS